MTTSLSIQPKFVTRLAILALLTSISGWASAQDFIVMDSYPETKDYYQACQDKCPDIEYRFIDSNVDWLDSIVNKAVVSNLKFNGNDDKASEQRWKTFDAIAKPNKAQLVNQLNFAISEFVKANQAWLQQSESDLKYSISSTPHYFGHKTLKNGNQLELLSVSGDQYLGGAHGVSWSNYYVFDRTNQRQIKLDDILMPNQKVILEKMVKAEYIKYLKENQLDHAEMAQTWEFFLTNNFSFSNKGLVLQYQHYDITPYVMGMPEFTIPYSQLKGVVKADYLN